MNTITIIPPTLETQRQEERELNKQQAQETQRQEERDRELNKQQAHTPDVHLQQQQQQQPPTDRPGR